MLILPSWGSGVLMLSSWGSGGVDVKLGQWGC